MQAVAEDDRSLAASGVTDFEYSHYRIFAKLDLAWQTRAWKVGLSITTPSLGLFGGGKAAYTVFVAGAAADPITSSPSFSSTRRWAGVGRPRPRGPASERSSS